MLGDGLGGPRRKSVSLVPWFTGLLPREPTGSGVHPDLVRPEYNPPPVSSSDEFKDPFSEDTGGGLWEMEGGKNIQDAKSAKVLDLKNQSICLPLALLAAWR
jgi:hypothetical protein